MDEATAETTVSSAAAGSAIGQRCSQFSQRWSFFVFRVTILDEEHFGQHPVGIGISR